MKLKSNFNILDSPVYWFTRLPAAFFSSVLWSLSFPDFNLGWLAWFALVPLILGCRGLGFIGAASLGLLSGMASIWGVFNWIFEVPGFRFYHMLLGAFWFALYPAAWCLGAKLVDRFPLPRLVTWPSLWVVLDYLKAHAGFMAFPWGTLAQSQHQQLPVLQVVSIFGEYGLTWLIVLANVALAEWIRKGKKAWPELAVAGSLIMLAYSWGTYELTSPLSLPSIRVAAVQPSILLKERLTPQGATACQERLEKLTREVRRERPILIAWPETAVRDLKTDAGLMRRLEGLSLETGISLVVGASDFVKFQYPGKLAFTRRQYNSAYFIEPGKPSKPPYRKVILLPFGEYLPLESLVDWPTWFIPRLYYVLPGDGPKIFQMSQGHRFGVIICWENLFSGYVRHVVHNGAQWVIHISNDNWFGPTAAPRQHNAATVLRAVENRIPVLLASNTGPSEIIDSYGRIVARQPGLFTEGFVVAEIGLNRQRTFYTRYGDLFAFGAIIAVVFSVLLKKKEKKTSDEMIRQHLEMDR
jgi:apolipoprotein N-acyltransferase